MQLIKLAALTIAAGATLGVAAVPAVAAPHRHKPRPHKVCKIERVHGHAKRVCRWVR